MMRLNTEHETLNIGVFICILLQNKIECGFCISYLLCFTVYAPCLIRMCILLSFLGAHFNALISFCYRIRVLVRIFWRSKEMALMFLPLSTVCCLLLLALSIPKMLPILTKHKYFCYSQSRITRWRIAVRFIFAFVSWRKRWMRRYWIWYAKKEEGPSYSQQIIKNQVHIRMNIFGIPGTMKI